MKVTAEQTKQAVEEWIKNIREDHQRILAMGASIDCINESYVEILVNALDLINRLETENRNLQVTNKKLREIKEQLENDIVNEQMNYEHSQEQIFNLNIELQAINNSRKCITGYNPHGLCSCCKADGQNCCIGCKDKQDCNISCGWIPGEEVSHGNQDV